MLFKCKKNRAFDPFHENYLTSQMLAIVIVNQQKRISLSNHNEIGSIQLNAGTQLYSEL
jgi:hypothetical protein